ncbi:MULTISPECIES: hypothetical protein [Mycobacteriaceae]|uniref:Uncharacterized protein n=1 Tax=Mycolicibacterium mucogenicum TaxID=56689 RepID=A0A4R5WBI0_MYCMU|nr:hypothetical protein [Mycolicibacterium mucogenicum]TDK86702.1 hypothetical protein EUA03_19205 [Mycolicibacterium mucogenicum]
MGKKGFIAVLIAVVVLFVAFVAVGTQQRDGDASAAPGGLLGRLMKSASGQSEVPLRDLSADCLKPGGVLVVQAGCKLKVPAGGDGLRTVRLAATQGSVEVSAPLPDPKGGPPRTVSKELTAGKDVNVAVGKDGAVISLSCLSCKLRIGG